MYSKNNMLCNKNIHNNIHMLNNISNNRDEDIANDIDDDNNINNKRGSNLWNMELKYKNE